MHTPATTHPRGALCAASDTSDASSGTPATAVTSPAPRSATSPVARPAPALVQPLFPPKDADAETRRRWLAHSPWPEVVFAAAV